LIAAIQEVRRNMSGTPAKAPARAVAESKYTYERAMRAYRAMLHALARHPTVRYDWPSLLE
jgi:hypothetical protein